MGWEGKERKGKEGGGLGAFGVGGLVYVWRE